ncbi:MAG: alpha/beta hydrolase [Polyangiaceae bacterium]|nr:alpha/beta hydrolase [Polyangiaceae bacterium]
MSLEAWRAGGSTFEWRGHHIFEKVDGRGDVLLLIHGFPTASWDWSTVWPELCARFRVITFDMIGFGFSAKPRCFEYSIRAQADLCEAVLARHDVGRYRLVAHDYGVTVAQELLARQRDRGASAIDRVGLLNGALFPETHRAALTQRLLASPLGPIVARLSSYRTFTATMRRIWGSHPVSDEELRAMWQLVIEGGGRAVLPALIGYMEERRRERQRWVGAIVHTKVPVRLVNGLDDPISGAHMVARYRELVASPDIAELRGVGHYPQVEAPDQVMRALLPFLERTS